MQTHFTSGAQCKGPAVTTNHVPRKQYWRQVQWQWVGAVKTAILPCDLEEQHRLSTEFMHKSARQAVKFCFLFSLSSSLIGSKQPCLRTFKQMFTDKCGQTTLCFGPTAALKRRARALKSWLCDDIVMVQRAELLLPCIYQQFTFHYFIMQACRVHVQQFGILNFVNLEKKTTCLVCVCVWVSSCAVQLSGPHSL